MQAYDLNESISENKLQVMKAIMRLSSYSDVTDYQGIPLFEKISAQMDSGVKLRFLLPAFPAKSPSPCKTSGVLPDLGEVLGLMNLHQMCESITAVYPQGAEVVICSDGRVFSDVVDVSDEVIDLYAQGISEIISSFSLTTLSTFSMDDVHPDLSPEDLRQKLLNDFAASPEQVRERVLNTQEGIHLFNGMHRFMVEDQKGRTLLSKTQVHKEMKLRTYELIRRSDAWSNLLRDFFPDALRLSIHPHPLLSEKFGVKLLTNASRWATPWHNVTVRVNGNFELMALDEARSLGAGEKTFGGKYVYFEL